MLIDAELPIKFWSESVKTAAHINNKCQSRNKNLTPFEIYKGRKPNIKYMKRFGSEAYVHIRRAKRGKMGQKALKGIMVGYSMKRKAYRVYIPDLEKIDEVGDVKFNELKLGSHLLKVDKFDENEIIENFYIQRQEKRIICNEDDHLESEIELNEEETEVDVGKQFYRSGNQNNGDEKMETEIEIDEEETQLEFNRSERENNQDEDEQSEPNNENDVNEEHEQDELNTRLKIGGSKLGMTKEMKRTRDHQIRVKNEEQLIKQGVRRSERVKEKNKYMNQADRAQEIKIPKSYQQVMISEQKNEWIEAMEQEMESKHNTKNVDIWHI